MNELDLIRSFRTDVPPPSGAATARAERAWRRAPQPRRPRWAPRAAIGGAVAAAAVAALLVLPGSDGGRLGPADARAAETLRRAAAVEAGAPARPLRPGEYWYIRRKTAWQVGGEVPGRVVHEVREDWVGVDGSRRWRTRRVGPSRGPSSDHSVDATPRPPFHVGDEAVTYEQLLALPRDPAELYERLRRAAVECECGNSVDEETFVIVGDLLRDNPIPADLRASLLRSAALIPGIELVERVRDVAGRTGVGVTYKGARTRTLVFDPATYELLAEKDGIGGAADVESAIVGSKTELP